MLSISLLALLACTVSAAPTERRGLDLDAALDISLDLDLNLIDLRQAKAPRCDVGHAQMTAGSLPPPSAGLRLYHVAVGRGTQNYTCDTTNATAIPAAAGAVATLFNVSCIAADAPSLLARIPGIALSLPTPASVDNNSPVSLAISGHHYFTDLTTPFFDLNTPRNQYGSGAFKKLSATPAPANAIAGPQNKGNGAVPWLKLVSKVPGQAIQEVYRLNTAGGVAPASCSGQPAAFQIQYAAEYWFWSV